MKVYIASSWKNRGGVRELAEHIRAMGFECDDFTDDSRGRFVFSWTEITENELKLTAKKLLEDERAQKAFKEDVSMIDWADVLILLLPSGKSSHMELGYAAGKGKEIIIFAPLGFEPGEWEVMYGFAHAMTDSLHDLIGYLADIWERKNVAELEV